MGEKRAYQDPDRVTALDRSPCEPSKLDDSAPNCESQLAAVLAALPVGFAIVDEHGGKIQANEEFTRVWGGTWPANEISDYVQYKAWWPDTGELVKPEEWASARAVLNGETVTGQVLQIERFDGTRAFVHNSAAPVRAAAGRITGAAVVIQDITTLRQAHDALGRSEARLAEAQRLANVGSWEWDIASGRLVWSEQTYRMFGCEPGEFTPSHETFLSCVHPDDRQRILVETEQALSRAKTYNQDYRIVLPDSSTRWVSARGEVSFDASGRPIRMAGTALDITDRKHSEERLAADLSALTRMHALSTRILEVETIESSMQEIMDAAVAIVGADKGTLQLLQGDALRIVAHCGHDRPFLEFFASAENVASVCGEATRRGERVIVEDTEVSPLFAGTESLAILRQAGVRAVQSTPLMSRTGTLLGILTTHWAVPHTPDEHDLWRLDLLVRQAADLLEQKRAEEALRKANASLEQKVQERTTELAQRAAQLRALAGELTLSEQRERQRMAKILHDHLQQLLVGAKFRLTVLGRHLDPVVRQATDEIAQLIDDSIQASRSLTAELSPPILHEAGLNAGLEWLARWMDDKHGLFVDLNMEEESAPVTDEVKVLLFESVRELLFNAVKHSGTRSAAVNLRRLDGQLQVVVSDQGAGFDLEAIPQAGEKGGGFGLFTVRERLDLVGGRLEIESAPGKGSRFVLTAPVGALPEVQPEPLAATERSQDSQAARVSMPTRDAPIRVLVVDDHAVTREGLKHMLGLESDIQIVGQAANGLEAVELAARLSPDVILMDISMPKLNGVDATRAIHADHPDIRIIGLSMFEQEEYAQALRNAGAACCLTKSGPSAELIAAIRQA